MWLACCAVLLVGVGVSVAGALEWRAEQERRAQQQFRSTAHDVTAAVAALLSRDVEFITTVRTVLTMEPGVSESRFHDWYRRLQQGNLQNIDFGTAVVESIPASSLSRFLARRRADPWMRAYFHAFVAVPRVGRAQYCLIALEGDSVNVDRASSAVMQGDWCDPSTAIGSFETPLLQAATDAGQLLVFSYHVGVHVTVLEQAFYQARAPLVTVAQRRAAVTGWDISEIDVAGLIRAAIGTHTNLTVGLYHKNPGDLVGEVGTGVVVGKPAGAGVPRAVLGRSGNRGSMQLLGEVGRAPGRGALSVTTPESIEGSWLVRVRGMPVGGGLSPDAQGLVVLIGGAIVSALLCVLVAVLARSRERALTLVAERTTELRQKTVELRHQALHDGLTGLPNRVLALDRAEQLLARARRSGSTAAALFVDIDGFKHVNDTFGHRAGDQLLRIVAVRLGSVVRESDTAARLAGDEFLVLLESSPLDPSPQLVAERLLAALREPYKLDADRARQLPLTASIGIAYGMHANAEQLLADADIAMYAAKGSGKDRYRVFESGMHTAIQDRLALECDLAQALEHDELFLLYQPTFDLRSERPVGFEALLRWQHPERGVIAPGQFIQLAEDSGVIVPVGHWVLRQACRQAAAWHTAGCAPGISVNVSGRQLDRDELVDHVIDALQDSGLDPSALTLEITETILMQDPDAATRRLLALKELGVKIAIDDFGTGYSSLAYLRQFPVDALKLDRSFIAGIATSTEAAALIHTLVRLGKTLRLQTLAEGIETSEQLIALQKQECDYGQGFLLARPLDADAAQAFLNTQPVNTPTTA